MKYSVYCSAFNIIDNAFDYESHIENFSEFLKDDGEIVICVNSSKDDTLNTLKALQKKYNSLKIINSDYSYSDPDLDGKIKNHALQLTTNPIKIQMDLDELFFISQKESIDIISSYFLNSNYQAVMLPVINLYKDEYHYKDIGFKWRIHKSGLFRGVVNFAKNQDGTHDINLSDSCELIDSYGNLVSSVYLNDPTFSDDKKLFDIKDQNIPYILHCGLLDIDKKVTRNKNFWKSHWEIESGETVEIELSAEEFDNKYLNNIKEHNLKLV